jgi:hypothetical protein
MVTPEEYQRASTGQTSNGSSTGAVSQDFYPSDPKNGGKASGGVPMLQLYNSSLNIRIQGINGAVIGRRQGPYVQFFQGNMYVSGVHAQLKYNAETGWSITDKHSSNGTKLNEHLMQPDAEMSLKNGDIVTIANINLQVSIN